MGAMMLSARAIDTARDIVVATDFYYGSIATIFTAALLLHDRGDPVDAITLADELGDERRVQVHEIAALVPAAGNVGHYAKIVKELALFRGLAEVALRIHSLAVDRERSAIEIISEAQELMHAQDGGAKADKRIPLFQALVDFEERMRSPEPVALGVPAPFSFLAPLQPARLYVLGGYQADGKTIAAAQFLRAAAEAGKKVGFVTVEMGWRDLTDRFISSLGVPYHRVQSGEIGSYQEAVDAALRTMARWNVDIIDDSDVNVASLRAYQRSYGYELLIIDHLHRIDWTDRRDLERTLRGITNIARDFDVPVLLLAQLSRSRREGLKSAFPRPTMASVRESGMIEAEAAAVWFVWRHRDDNDLPMDETEFIIAKNRFGETGVRSLYFKSREVHFMESA